MVDSHPPVKKFRSGIISLLIGVILIFLFYLLFPSLLASILLILAFIFIIYGICDYLRFRSLMSYYYLIWYTIFPVLFIFIGWLFLISPIFLSLSPKQYSEESALFPTLIGITLAITGTRMGKLDQVNQAWPRFSYFISPFSRSFLILIPYAFFTDIEKFLPFSYGIFFLFVTYFTISFFYFGLDSKNESLSKFSGQIINGKESLGVYFFVIGFFLGLYLYTLNLSFSIVFLIIILVALIVGIIYAVKGLYRNTSARFDESSITTFHRFAKISPVTEYSDISYMGKALEEFEREGKKDEMIVAVTKFLTERGMDIDFIKRILKRTMEYTPPKSVSMGLASGSNRVYEKEVERRKNISDEILRYLGGLGEKNE